MSIIHFLNVLQGDCNIIEHNNSKRVTVIDVSNADSDGIYENADLRNAIKEDISDSTTGNYGQKKYPENPIKYLERLKIDTIWRFIVSHPDMDHLDGIRDFFSALKVYNVWDTANTKKIEDFSSLGRFNKYDWDYYKNLRDEKLKHNYFKLFADKNNPGQYWTEDYIKILCPTKALLDNANVINDFNDSSYVILYTPPIGSTGKKWKILFCGDSHDKSMNYILENFKEDVTNIDVLIAPHHGRDSDRNYDFIKVLNPRVTLFGNASSKNLAYDKYPGITITNNQAGSVIIKCNESLNFYAKNEKYVNDYRKEHKWEGYVNKDIRLDAFPLFDLPPK